MLSLLIFSQYSCKKEFAKASSKGVETANLLPKNKELLNVFLQNQQSDEVASRGAGLASATVWNGMLFFPDTAAVRSYVVALDSLESQWDYSNEGIYDGTPQEITHLGDEAFRAVDQAKGFNSLRAKYDLLCFQNFNFQENLPFYVGDPDKKRIMNANLGLKYNLNSENSSVYSTKIQKTQSNSENSPVFTNQIALNRRILRIRAII